MSRRRLLALRPLADDEPPQQKTKVQNSGCSENMKEPTIFRTFARKYDEDCIDCVDSHGKTPYIPAKIDKIDEIDEGITANHGLFAVEESFFLPTAETLDSSTISVENDECAPTQRTTSESLIAKEVTKEAVGIALDENKISCPSCGKNLTFFNEEAQMLHVNACLDTIQEIERNKRDTELQAAIAASIAASGPIQPSQEVETCKICGVPFAGKSARQRVQHTKQCAKKYGVSLQSLLKADPLVQEVGEKSSETSLQTNAFDALMQRQQKPPRPHQPSPTPAMENAFDVMMRGAKTNAVMSKKQAEKPSSAVKRKAFNNTTKYSCPDYKKIKGTDIIVDGFQYASPTLSTTYVLSHFHSDHYTGLTKSFGAGIIYCTPITARLVTLCLGVNEKYLHPIPLNQPYKLPNHNIQMTFLDANHCPGAALILFQFSSGKSCLHTGDFRYDPRMLQNRYLAPYLGPHGNRLDFVYLDTTYCAPQHCHPTQAVAIAEAKRLVDLHHGDRALFLVGSYSIGKERLFMEVAAHLDCKVFVERAKLSLLSCFEWPRAEQDRLTTESSITNLHVVPMNHLNFDGMRALLMKHRLRFKKVIALQPTGWTFSKKKGPAVSSKRSQMNDSLIIYGIPYSEHSSFDELCAFTKAFEPKTIIPTVNCSKSTQQVDLLRQTCFNNLTHHFNSSK